MATGMPGGSLLPPVLTSAPPPLLGMGNPSGRKLMQDLNQRVAQHRAHLQSQRRKLMAVSDSSDGDEGFMSLMLDGLFEGLDMLTSAGNSSQIMIEIKKGLCSSACGDAILKCPDLDYDIFYAIASTRADFCGSSVPSLPATITPKPTTIPVTPGTPSPTSTKAPSGTPASTKAPSGTPTSTPAKTPAATATVGGGPATTPAPTATTKPTTGTPAPTTAATPVPTATPAGPTIAATDKVTVVSTAFKFPDLDLAGFSDAVEKQFVSAVAKSAKVQDKYVVVTDKKAGSVVVTTKIVFPANSTAATTFVNTVKTAPASVFANTTSALAKVEVATQPTTDTSATLADFTKTVTPVTSGAFKLLGSMVVYTAVALLLAALPLLS